MFLYVFHQQRKNGGSQNEQLPKVESLSLRIKSIDIQYLSFLPPNSTVVVLRSSLICEVKEWTSTILKPPWVSDMVLPIQWNEPYPFLNVISKVSIRILVMYYCVTNYPQTKWHKTAVNIYYVKQLRLKNPGVAGEWFWLKVLDEVVVKMSAWPQASEGSIRAGECAFKMLYSHVWASW